ncbi:DUF7855 family protein [Halosegnis rubeus]|jgi:hypothetical protein|uniref:Uncharacterized protein n=1 Tax=Halosegnis rubeus TaxID=2212850 RepID=A0A5N5UAP8_9EURY|nr:hypothetical protein [Halosegnis rubeus]KAB7513500.1 hypothetical protein DP108_13000 [Halosegnis rubeus]KAB7515429.1 hypothetical protein DMP03_09430 [Halosegnis rubeus]
MLFVVAYSRAARRTLRNLRREHEETVVREFGRAALLEPTGHGALLACRLRERYPDAVRVERTRPFNEFAVPEIHEAAVAYENEASKYTPYARFASGTDHPDPDTLRDRTLDAGL